MMVPELFLYTTTTALPPDWLLRNPSIRNIPDMRNHYAGLGYGLPVARVYAKYFGGDLKVCSLLAHLNSASYSLWKVGERMRISIYRDWRI